MNTITEKEEKKVEYLELIYDLIFVYIIGRNNSLLHSTVDGMIQPGMFLAYVLCTLAVIQIWNFSTYYINIYGRNGLREHIFLFSNMFLLYFVAEGTREHWENYHTQYHAAWALILLNIALQYFIELRSRRNEPEHTASIKRILITLVAEAVLVTAVIFVYLGTGIDVSGIPILFGILMTFLTGGKGAAEFIDFAHLSERAMLYVVFTFGEMVIAIAGYFEGEFSPALIYYALMAFLIVVGLFLSYGTVYDKIIDRERKDNGLVYMMLHIFMIFGLNNITNSLEFMREEEMELVPKIAFLIGSFLLYYVFLFATRRYSKADCKPALSFYLKMLGIAVSFIVLMLVFREQMMINIAVTAVYVFVIYAVIYRAGKVNKAVTGNKTDPHTTDH